LVEEAQPDELDFAEGGECDAEDYYEDVEEDFQLGVCDAEKPGC
jgi:hypothetical protein